MSQQALSDLPRWQWALTAGFHIIFPSLTVGVSMFVRVAYAAFMRTGNAVYQRLFRLWRRIVAHLEENVAAAAIRLSRGELELLAAA